MALFRIPPTLMISGQRFALFNLTSEVSVNIFLGHNNGNNEDSRTAPPSANSQLRQFLWTLGNSCYLAKYKINRVGEKCGKKKKEKQQQKSKNTQEKYKKWFESFSILFGIGLKGRTVPGNCSQHLFPQYDGKIRK